MPEIIQTDAVLCEDLRTVLLYGHAKSDHETYTASFRLPMTISQAAFLPNEWLQLTAKADWRRHG